MTENELRKLSPAQRQALPESVVLNAVLTTKEEAVELLTLEGWEFVGIDDRDEGEDGPFPEIEPSQVWRRRVGGRTEWCDLHNVFVLRLPPELPPEKCWFRQVYPCDPRLIED